MQRIHLGGLAGVLTLLTVVLAGCSLLFPPQAEEEVASEVGIAAPEGWLLAAQGADALRSVCEQDLSRSEARQEAKEALREDEEVQELQQVLAALGKRLMIWRAKGCEVSTEDESEGSDASGQELFAQQQGEGPETVLVEVPAGPDAALYLVETQGLDEGNSWVSLKEIVEEGEVLTHIEVGLEGDAEVQGLSADGDVGAVQFLLPNGEITKEIAEQVRKLLEGSGSTTEGSGVWGMSSGQELDWSRAEVLLLEGNVVEGEEVEALLMIPVMEDETGSTALWKRTGARVDPQRVLYAGVTVKKGTSSGGPNYRVTSKTAVTRIGSTVTSKTPVICPYRYYGPTEAYRRLLCRWWEGAATDKLKSFFLNKALDVLPEIQDLLGMLTTTDPQGESTETGNSSTFDFLAIMTKDRGVIGINVDDVDPNALLEILQGDKENFDDISLKSPSLLGQALVTLAGLLFGMWGDFQIQQDINFDKFVNNIQKTLRDFLNIWRITGSEEELQAAIENCFEPVAPPQSAACEDFTEFFNAVLNAFKEQGFNEAEARRYLIELLMAFIMNIQWEAQIDGIVEKWGMAGVILFGALIKGAENSFPFGEYPGADRNSILYFLDQLFALRGQVGNFNSYLEDLLAASMAFALQRGDTVAVAEYLAELFALADIFQAMIDHGWRGVTYQADSGLFDFGGVKEFFVRGIGQFTWELRGDVEGYLAPGEAQQLFEEIERKVEDLNALTSLCPYCSRYAYIMVLVSYDEAEKNALCDRVSNTDFGLTPVIIVDRDGNILCHSKNVTPEGAEDILNNFGLGGGATEEIFSSNAYGVPIGDPTTGTCRQKNIQCLLP